MFQNPIIEAPQILATKLLGGAPNPFNPTTTIRFNLARQQHVALAVYDLAGKRIVELFAGELDVGEYSQTWFGRDDRGQAVPSGTYIARLTTVDRIDGTKLQLVR